MIHQMRRGLGHAAGVAGDANVPSLARKREQEVVTTVSTVRPGKAIRQNSARQALAEISLDVFTNRIPVGFAGVRERQAAQEIE
jgi:hypothetical protein